ncbi:MAG: LacI family DNA-binding transcriptional regulator [Halieaceae bacterium]
MPEKSPGTISSLQDLADLAGVSRATASRALSDNPRISKKTRDRVQALARSHGYVVNRGARDLRLQRSSIISVVFMLDMRSKQHMSDQFFMEMLGSIADASSDRDYDLLLTHAPETGDMDAAVNNILQRSDGVIFVGQEKRHNQLNAIAESGHPIIVWGQRVPGKRYPVVGSDNFEGGRAVTLELLDKGRSRIAFFGGVDNPELASRFSGYQAALNERGLEFDPQLHFDVPFSLEQAEAAVARLLEQHSDFDAVVCMSDVMAMATVGALQGFGLRVPEDVAVTGYDNISLAAFVRPSLTTVSQSISMAGEALVDGLLRRMRGESVPDVTLPADLIVRDSSLA